MTTYSTSRIFLLRDTDPDTIHRELATVAPGKVINGHRVTVVLHIGEITAHEQGGYRVIVCVEVEA